LEFLLEDITKANVSAEFTEASIEAAVNLEFEVLKLGLTSVNHCTDSLGNHGSK